MVHKHIQKTPTESIKPGNLPGVIKTKNYNKEKKNRNLTKMQKIKNKL